MSYTLYVGENCHQCQIVLSYMEKEEICHKKVNVDLDNEEPPIDLFAFPALFQGNELIKYGTDIIAYFQKKSRNESFRDLG